jgi:hypothetical protein
MKRGLTLLTLLFASGIFLGLGATSAHASGTASNIYGLYYTGDTAGGSALAAGGTQDGNWKVTYASTNGGSSANTTYEGPAYVVTAANTQNAAWTSNTSTAQWITAPGAVNTSGTSPNTGGDDLPGNGDSGANAGYYLYTLAFTITGTGSGTVSNNIAISLTISADDSYYVWVDPSGNGTTIPGTSASASGTNAWNNTTSITLANYTNTAAGITNNASFQIGTNYLVIGVINSNSITGTSAATAVNPSGLLVYQVGSVALINGKPVPEMSTWLPLALATAIGGFLVWHRRQAVPAFAPV